MPNMLIRRFSIRRERSTSGMVLSRKYNIEPWNDWLRVWAICTLVAMVGRLHS